MLFGKWNPKRGAINFFFYECLNKFGSEQTFKFIQFSCCCTCISFIPPFVNLCPTVLIEKLEKCKIAESMKDNPCPVYDTGWKPILSFNTEILMKHVSIIWYYLEENLNLYHAIISSAWASFGHHKEMIF